MLFDLYVPTRMHDQLELRLRSSSGLVHTLSLQLIQSPCGYDVLQLYEGGVARTTYEIDEQHYCEVARAAYADRWPERYGAEEDRNFFHAYASAAAVTDAG